MKHNIVDFVIRDEIRSSDYRLQQVNNKLSTKTTIGLFNRLTVRCRKLKPKNMYRFELFDGGLLRSLDIRLIHQSDTRRHLINSDKVYFIDKDYMAVLPYYLSETIFNLLEIPLDITVAHPIHGLIEKNVSAKDLIFNKYFSQNIYNVDGAVYLINGANKSVIDSINKSIAKEKELYKHEKSELERRHKERLSMLENAKNEIINSINI